jgi:hypothetical protein
MAKVIPKLRQPQLRLGNDFRLYLMLMTALGGSLGLLADAIAETMPMAMLGGTMAGIVSGYIFGRKAGFVDLKLLSYVFAVVALGLLIFSDSLGLPPTGILAGSLLVFLVCGYLAGEGVERFIGVKFLQKKTDGDDSEMAQVIMLDLKRRYNEEVAAGGVSGRLFTSQDGIYSITMSEEDGLAAMKVMKLNEKTPVLERYFGQDEWYLERGVDFINCRFSNNGFYLAISAGAENPVEVYDLTEGLRLRRITGLKDISGIEFISDSELVVSADGKDNYYSLRP